MSNTEKLHIIPHLHTISMTQRNLQNGHKSVVLWFTGLSGSGKSTISDRVEVALMDSGIHTFVLDGDNIRTGLNCGLGFSTSDRKENLRRIAETGKLFIEAGIVTLCSFVSPLRRDREMVRNIIGDEYFIEVFVNTSLVECERRDVKGLYKKARAGEIKNFTGIDAPYEPPSAPDITVNTQKLSVEESVQIIIEYLFEKLKIKNL